MAKRFRVFETELLKPVDRNDPFRRLETSPSDYRKRSVWTESRGVLLDFPIAIFSVNVSETLLIADLESLSQDV